MPDELTRASTRTAVTAISVNAGIAVAKAAAAGITGSAALWAETAHSVADTGNEVLLLIGLRRSALPRDRTHPFGYGQERWFWAFVAAIGIFIGGGLLSIDEGVGTIRRPRPVGSYWLGVVVLLVSMVLDGFSWRTARREPHYEARMRGRSFVDYLRVASDPTAPTVFLEDSASLIGLALALAGLTLQRMTGSVLWDAGASIAIGALLVVVAFLLARRSKGLLINESAPPEMVERLRERPRAAPGVAAVPLIHGDSHRPAPAAGHRAGGTGRAGGHGHRRRPAGAGRGAPRGSARAGRWSQRRRSGSPRPPGVPVRGEDLRPCAGPSTLDGYGRK